MKTLPEIVLHRKVRTRKRGIGGVTAFEARLPIVRDVLARIRPRPLPAMVCKRP